VVCSPAAPELGLHCAVRLLLLAGAAVTHTHHNAALVIPALDILLVLGLSRIACNKLTLLMFDISNKLLLLLANGSFMREQPTPQRSVASTWPVDVRHGQPCNSVVACEQ
jgi:hypothetical protein